MYCSISKFHRQSGTVLLAFLLIFIIGSAFGFLNQLNASNNPGVYNQRTQNALAQAKEALIAHAVTYYDSHPGEHGFLPCPDVGSGIGTEGNPDPTCGGKNINSLGKLPWKTLGTPPLRDASGECLWYAVSGEFKVAVKTEMLNEDTYGTFDVTAIDGVTRLAGNTTADRAVAVIIAPGKPIGDQARTTNPADPQVQICGGNYTATNYLEDRGSIDNATLSAGVDGIDTFIAATDQTAIDKDDTIDDVNDVMVFITADEIMSRVQARNDFDDKFYDDAAAIDNLTKVLAECLKEYAESHTNVLNDSLPWPAPVDLVDYRDDAEYDDVDGVSDILSGRLPDLIDDSRTAIDAAGRTNLITGCSRFDDPTPQEQEYLALWQNWKDHFFYAVADAYQPQADATPTVACGAGVRCITINGDAPGDDYAAVVIFSNSPLATQSRDAPPIDADTKLDIGNYLEDYLPIINTDTYLDTAADDTKRFDIGATSNVFNDIYYCINDNDTAPTNLQVTLCPTI